jgi:ubiquitin C-terminal hydrolase
MSSISSYYQTFSRFVANRWVAAAVAIIPATYWLGGAYAAIGAVGALFLANRVGENQIEGAPRGIPNQGNTCFAASLVQMIANSPQLKKGFRDMYQELIRTGNSNKKEAESIGKIVEVLGQYERKEGIQIGSLHSIFGENNDQQDATELLNKVIPDNIPESIGIKIPEFSPSRKEYVEGPLKFPMLIVKAPPSGGRTHLLKALFFTQMQQYGDTESKHSGDFREGETHSINRLIKAPEIFIFSLVGKREIEIPLIFEFPNYLLDNSPEYTLQSFLVHLGNGEEGHYIAYVMKDNKFYRLNDGRVESISQKQYLEAAQKAYLVNYSRS